MRIRVLGSSAGGGLPQWNCRCPNCLAARSGAAEVQSRTQSSVAVRADGEPWFLLNASPDIRQQILDFRELTPEGVGPRATNLAGCILTDAEIDHASGLLFLREPGAAPISIYSSSLVRQWLTDDFPALKIVGAFSPRPWRELRIGEAARLTLPNGEESALSIRAFDLDPHSPKFVAAPPADLRGSVVGLEIVDSRSGSKFVYAPCVASRHPALEEACRGARALLMDGTFWSDDEPLRMGISERTAREMGHWPVSGPEGSLAWLESLPVKERVYVHINNTNPMLRKGGAESEAVARAGARVGHDDLEIILS